MRSRAAWWSVFGACAAFVLGGLTWLTIEMLRLERVEYRARYEIEYEGAVRLALWRMESWLAPRLAREATRPYFEYLPYYPHRRAYDSMWRSIVPDEVQTPSPLLTFESDLVLLHFQVDDGGHVTSPQVPTGNALDVAQSTLVRGERVERMQARLKRLERILGDARELEALVVDAERRLDAEMESNLIAASAATADEADLIPRKLQSWAQEDVSKLEQQRREQNFRYGAAEQQRAQTRQMAQQMADLDDFDASCELEGDEPPLQMADVAPTVVVGSFVPIWLDDLEEGCVDVDGDERCVLVMLRRVRSGRETRVQGVLLDWTTLREQLHAQIQDLFPDAELRRLANESEAGAHVGRALVQIPVAMIVGTPQSLAITGLTSMRLTILIVWIVILAAVIAVAVTLRASVAYGESRSRFASSVTHELRTPLTTFRMYSEMLAAGMVTDESQRQTYLQTLHSEADRLAALVENVLAYARLERGRTTLAPRSVGVAEVQDLARPALERRAARSEASIEWCLEIDGERRLETDPEVLNQILLNLVDNACKYGADPRSGQATITITVAEAADGNGVAWHVCDAGPGITPAQQRAIFEPFDRGGRPPGETTPGLGLGLALSRGLARRLGGDLETRAHDGGGACFVVRMPRG